MELEKPATIQVKTPLEREIARLKGYNYSDLSSAPPVDVVKEFD